MSTDEDKNAQTGVFALGLLFMAGALVTSAIAYDREKDPDGQTVDPVQTADFMANSATVSTAVESAIASTTLVSANTRKVTSIVQVDLSSTGTPVDLSAPPDMLDGVAIQVGFRVLLRNQLNQTENSVFVVQAGPTWTEDPNLEIPPAGVLTFVRTGNQNGGQYFMLQVVPDAPVRGSTLRTQTDITFPNLWTPAGQPAEGLVWTQSGLQANATVETGSVDTFTASGDVPYSSSGALTATGSASFVGPVTAADTNPRGLKSLPKFYEVIQLFEDTTITASEVNRVYVVQADLKLTVPTTGLTDGDFLKVFINNPAVSSYEFVTTPTDRVRAFLLDSGLAFNPYGNFLFLSDDTGGIGLSSSFSVIWNSGVDRWTATSVFCNYTSFL